MKSQHSLAKPRPKTSTEIGEMVGTGRVLDAAIRRAVKQAIEARELRRKLQNPTAVLGTTGRQRRSSR